MFKIAARIVLLLLPVGLIAWFGLSASAQRDPEAFVPRLYLPATSFHYSPLPTPTPTPMPTPLLTDGDYALDLRVDAYSPSDYEFGWMRFTVADQGQTARFADFTYRRSDPVCGIGQHTFYGSAPIQNGEFVFVDLYRPTQPETWMQCFVLSSTMAHCQVIDYDVPHDDKYCNVAIGTAKRRP